MTGHSKNSGDLRPEVGGKHLRVPDDDGYLFPAFTIDPENPALGVGNERWMYVSAGSHELYNAGHLIEAAVAHYLLTNATDARLYNAAKKLADCWCENLGPPPRKPWYDGHQAMEIARMQTVLDGLEGRD